MTQATPDRPDETAPPITPTQDAAASTPHTAEHARLAEAAGPDSPWRLWGPYLAGRQWGTVVESDRVDAPISVKPRIRS